MKKKSFIAIIVLIAIVAGATIVGINMKDKLNAGNFNIDFLALEKDNENESVNVEFGEASSIKAAIPIFMYHWIKEDTGGYIYEENMVKPDELRKQMEFLKEENYDVLFVSDLANIQHYSKPVMLTFDDGWEDVYKIAYPIAQELGMKFNMYIITDLVGTPGYCTWEQLKTMKESGLVEYGSHTLSHPYLADLSIENVTKELVESKAKLIEELDMDIPVICYPSGNQNAGVQKVSAENYEYGLLMDGGIFYYEKGVSNLYAIERIYCRRSTDINTFKNYCKQASVTIGQ